MPNSRRKFMQQMAILAASQPTVPLIRTFADLGKKKSLGVALVGLGYYSTEVLAPALQKTKHCHLAGIVTGTPEKAAKWQEKYDIPQKNCYNYENFDQIANNDAIDVVYIVLPNAMHHPFTLRAAAAGKHVWCEKPMAMSVRECAEMIKACADNKVSLSIGYRMQHEPNTQEIIRFRREQTFGKIHNVTCTAGFKEWRKEHWHLNKELGGGAMYDMGVYPLNAARYVVGEEPMAVTAVQKVHRPELFVGIDETMHYVLEFPGGAVANCTTSLGINLRNYLMVNCEDGWYTLSPFSNYNGVEGSTSKGKILNELVNEPMPHEQVRQMDNDARAILNKEKALVPGEEGLNDIRVLEAVYLSAREGKRIEIK
jgi:glucose-fructose oxidoreductase